MGLIDGKGRVFGKVNLIDLVVVVATILVFVIAFFVVTRGGKITLLPEDKEIELTVLIYELRPELVSAFHIGDVVKRKDTQGVIGTIKDVKVQPATVITRDDEGQIIVAVSPVEKDVYLTLTCKGRVGKDIITTGNEVLRMTAPKDKKFAISTKWFEGEAYIVDLKVK